MIAHLEDLELLKKQHAEWDRLLKKEQERPSPDVALVQNYKKHKLQVKEEIQKVEKALFEVEGPETSA